MFKTDILFTGFYGYKNTGDDAFVEIASWGAARYWNKHNNRFLAMGRNLPDTIVPSKGYPFQIPKTYGIQLNWLIRNTNFLISAGGSTIHSKLDENNPKMIALREKKKNKKLKIGGIGVSIGPFTSIDNEKAVQQYLKSIDFLTVRDLASFSYVQSLDLPYRPIRAFDLAAMLPKVYNYHKDTEAIRSKKVVGISVCPVESVNPKMDSSMEKIRNQMLVDLIRTLDKEGDIHFKFFVINGHPVFGDLNLTNETISQSQPKSFELVNYNANTRAVWRSIADCDFIVSTRLHAAIFACFANTPFMLNEYHRKCSDFLDDIGYDMSLRLHNSEYDVTSKARQVLEVLNDTSLYPIPNQIEAMKELSKRNFSQVHIL